MYSSLLHAYIDKCPVTKGLSTKDTHVQLKLILFTVLYSLMLQRGRGYSPHPTPKFALDIWRNQYITCSYTFLGGSKATVGYITPPTWQYLDIAWRQGQYLDVAQEGGFQLSFDPHFDL